MLGRKLKEKLVLFTRITGRSALTVVLISGLMPTAAFAETSSRLDAAVPGDSRIEVLSRSFPDVADSESWYYDSVYAASDMGLIEGYDDGTFGPGNSLSRAQAATILWRYYCPEEAAAYDEETTESTWNDTGMPDVDDGQWYTAAANWAVAEGIISGKGEGADRRFDPNGPITREQLCAIVANASAVFAGSSIDGGEEILNAMPDATDVSSWAIGSVAWGLQESVISGVEAGGARYVRPALGVDRATMAAVVMNAVNADLLGERGSSGDSAEYVDSDGDGIPDEVESDYLGTDPNSFDSLENGDIPNAAVVSDAVCAVDGAAECISLSVDPGNDPEDQADDTITAVFSHMPADCAIGKILMFDVSDQGNYGLKISSVSTNDDGTCTVVGTHPNVGETFELLYVCENRTEGTVDMALGDGWELLGTSDPQSIDPSLLSTSSESVTLNMDQEYTFGIKLSDKKETNAKGEISVTVKIDSVYTYSLYYDGDLVKTQSHVDGEVTVSGKVSLKDDLSATFGIPIPILSTGIPAYSVSGIGSADVDANPACLGLYVDLGFNLSIKAEMSFSSGWDFELDLIDTGSALPKIEQKFTQKKNPPTFTGFTASAGVSVSVKIFVKLSTYVLGKHALEGGVEVGPEGDAKVTNHSDADLSCIDVGVWVGMDAVAAIASDSKHLKLEGKWPIWDESNSPLTFTWHYENGEYTGGKDSCTYKKGTITPGPVDDSLPDYEDNGYANDVLGKQFNLTAGHRLSVGNNLVTDVSIYQSWCANYQTDDGTIFTIKRYKSDGTMEEDTVSAFGSIGCFAWENEDELVVVDVLCGRLQFYNFGTLLEREIPRTAVISTCNTVAYPLHLSASSVTFVQPGQTYQLTAVTDFKDLGIDDSDEYFWWSTSDYSVATVDENGLVTAKGSGEAVVTVEFGGYTRSCKITVP